MEWEERRWSSLLWKVFEVKLIVQQLRHGRCPVGLLCFNSSSSGKIWLQVRVKSKRNSYFFKPYINYKNSIYKSSFIKFRSIPQFCDNTWVGRPCSCLESDWLLPWHAGRVELRREVFRSNSKDDSSNVKIDFRSDVLENESYFNTDG